MKLFEQMTDSDLAKRYAELQRQLERANWEIEYAVANYATTLNLLERAREEITARKPCFRDEPTF